MAATHTTAQFGDLPSLDFDPTSIPFPSSLPASSAPTSPVFAAPPPASQSAHGPPTIGAFQCIAEAQNQWIKYWNNLALSIIPPERIPEYPERFYSDPAGFQKACADAEFSRGWIHIMRGMEKEVDNWWVSKGWEGWWAEYERGGESAVELAERIRTRGGEVSVGVEEVMEEAMGRKGILGRAERERWWR